MDLVGRTGVKKQSTWQEQGSAISGHPGLGEVQPALHPMHTELIDASSPKWGLREKAAEVQERIAVDASRFGKEKQEKKVRIFPK